jgi:CRP/FNR family transcriptional regulator
MSRISSEDTLTERIDFLKTAPLFSELRDSDLKIVAQDLHLKAYRKGEIVFHQGDEGQEMYIVVQGKIRIFKTSPSGSETSITILAAGDVIGEFATIDRQPRSATAKAIVKSTLLQIMGSQFLYYMRRMPDLATAMNRLLVEKTRWTAAYAETIAQFDAAGRLLHILLLYNEKMGQEIEPGKRYLLDLGLNQTDLASLVGARREWVNRLLRDWQRRGLIEVKAGQITILDLPLVEDERDSRIEANL